MKKLVIYSIALSITNSFMAMDKKDIWIKTTDSKLSSIPSTTVQSSNLLKFLNTKYNGSDSQPLLIPPSLSLNADLLNLYCDTHGTKTKNLELTPDCYYQLIDAAEKLKDPKRYKSLIRNILPQEDEDSENPRNLSSLIAEKWIGTLIRTEAIKKNHMRHEFLTIPNALIARKPKLITSPHGDYFIHNITKNFTMRDVVLCNTKTNATEYKFCSRNKKSIYFSPDNNYFITYELDGTYLHHIATQQKHLLLDRTKPSSDIIISSDGKYILHKGTHPFLDNKPFYTLWKMDQLHKPAEIALKDNLIDSHSVVFHPNNEQIYHNRGKLYLYDIATQEDMPLSSEHDCKKIFLVHNLVLSPDQTHIICNAWIKNTHEFIERHALVNIQNHENVIATEIPIAFLHADTYVAPLCTARTHLVTHVCNKGKTLQLLDENMKCIASHNATENSYISALAMDHTGDYLASGYSDSTIILWDISDPQKNIYGKKLIGSHGMIKKLTFTDNHLLLSQSEFGQFRDTDEPCATPGTAILWNMHGNQIINFGNAVLTSKISKNGTKIAIIDAALEIHGKKEYWQKYVTVSCYNLDVPIKAYTLKQAYKLIKKYNS